MTEAEWLALSTDPLPTARHAALEFLGERATSRKLRLFGCACCYRIEDLVRQHGCLEGLRMAEQFADGLVMEAAIRAASDAVCAVADAVGVEFETCATACAVSWAISTGPNQWNAETWSLSAAMASAARHAAMVRNDGERERAEQFNLLRDVFGNPFRPVAFAPEWRTDTAVTLARQMYESREFGAMPILADALQDAGCDSDEVLNHCRDASQAHVRGCWVCDLVLGKE